MSEYQYVAFRAIDAAVSDKDLEFMRKQSSRAEITPWTFDNEYNFGDFHGDAEEMLRRGYDFHVHYADFGIRKIMIRLPQGLPDTKAAEPYLEDEDLELVEDKKGPGVILAVSPFIEPGELDEPYDLLALIERLTHLRKEILDGDLRPLYLAHLAVMCDGNHDPEEETEGPVPAGLKKLTDAQRALAEFLGLDNEMLSVAAVKSPPLVLPKGSDNLYAIWLEKQPEKAKTAWLSQLMTDPKAEVRREILAEFRKSHGARTWPTVVVERKVAELMD